MHSAARAANGQRRPVDGRRRKRPASEKEGGGAGAGHPAPAGDRGGPAGAALPRVPFITFVLVTMRVSSSAGIPGYTAHIMTHADNWLLWAVLSAVFAALTAIFAKIGLEGVNPDLATLVRTVVVVVLLAAFVWFSGQWSNPFSLSTKTLLFLALSALATGASWVCYFRALQLGEASKVAPVDKFSVVLVAVIAFLVLGERPSVRDWAGIALVALGVLLLALRR